MADMGEWGRIVTALVDYLDIPRFDVLAISSRAPYGYAIGHSLPNEVKNIFVLSGTPASFDSDIASHWPFPVNRDLTIDELQSLASELFFSDVNENDKHRDPSVRSNHFHYGVRVYVEFRPVYIRTEYRSGEFLGTASLRHAVIYSTGEPKPYFGPIDTTRPVSMRHALEWAQDRANAKEYPNVAREILDVARRQ